MAESKSKTIPIIMYDREFRKRSTPIYDENYRHIGEANIVKRFICNITKKAKLSLQITLKGERKCYHTAQVYEKTRLGWMNAKATNFNF